MNDSVIDLVSEIKKAHRIVFFGGAGVSTSSGIPDFRSSSGLYHKEYGGVSAEEILSHHYFLKSPDRFYKFLKDKMLYLDAKPNYVHDFIASMERDYNKDVAVITQNIDGLHQKAGSMHVVELHGNILDYYCMGCGKEYDVSCLNTSVPTCSCGSMIRPQVVLYEEALDDEAISDAISSIKQADLMIVIGTSLVVQPAASLIRYFNGKCLVIVNQTKTDYDSLADIVIYDDLVSVFKKVGSNFL